MDSTALRSSQGWRHLVSELGLAELFAIVGLIWSLPAQYREESACFSLGALARLGASAADRTRCTTRRHGRNGDSAESFWEPLCLCDSPGWSLWGLKPSDAQRCSSAGSAEVQDAQRPRNALLLCRSYFGVVRAVRKDSRAELPPLRVFSAVGRCSSLPGGL